MATKSKKAAAPRKEGAGILGVQPEVMNMQEPTTKEKQTTRKKASTMGDREGKVPTARASALPKTDRAGRKKFGR